MTPPLSAVRAADAARRLAEARETHRAMRALALADALQRLAAGDRVGKRLALLDARGLREAIKRRKETTR